MGNIPLTIAQGAPQFCSPIQSIDPYNLPKGQFQTNSILPIGFIESTPDPGYPQQISPYGDQSSFTTPYTQPTLYSQTQQHNQSQLTNPDLDTQQPVFNPSYPNLNPK